MATSSATTTPHRPLLRASSSRTLVMEFAIRLVLTLTELRGRGLTVVAAGGGAAGPTCPWSGDRRSTRPTNASVRGPRGTLTRPLPARP